MATCQTCPELDCLVPTFSVGHLAVAGAKALLEVGGSVRKLL
ncbi:MAG: hypothetical protein ACUVWR_04400 [Anaerolineae bacterium]